MGNFLVVNSHDIFQGVFEPLERIYLVLFADSKEWVDHDRSLCTFMRSGKEVILRADGHWSDDILQRIVVDL